MTPNTFDRTGLIRLNACKSILYIYVYPSGNPLFYPTKPPQSASKDDEEP